MSLMNLKGKIIVDVQEKRGGLGKEAALVLKFNDKSQLVIDTEKVKTGRYIFYHLVVRFMRGRYLSWVWRRGKWKTVKRQFRGRRYE